MISWDKNNNTIKSLTRNNKKIVSIVRNSDNKQIYKDGLNINYTLSSNYITVGDEVTITIVITNKFDIPMDNLSVTLSDGTNTLYTATTDSNGSITYTYTATSAGTDTIYATVNYYTSAINLIIDGIHTNISIDVPLSLVYSDNFNITGYLTDTSSNTLSNKTVYLLVGNTIVDNTTTGNDGSFSFTQTPVNMGTHSFQIQFDGDSVYTNSTSSIITREINKETSVLNLTSPVNNDVCNPSVTINVDGNLSTNDGEPISNASVLVQQDNTTITTLTTDSDGDFTGTISGNDVSAGTLTFLYEATTYYTASQVDITLTNKQNSTLSIARSNESISYGSSVTISGVLSAGSGESVKIYRNNSLLTTVTTTTDGAYSYSVGGLSVGSHSFYAVYDGNTYYNGISTESISVTVVKANPGFSAGANPSTFYSSGGTTISGTLSAGGGQTITISGAGSATLTTDGNGSFSWYSGSMYGEGYYSFNVSFAGNSSYNGSTITVVVRLIKYPSTLTISANPSTASVGGSTTLSGTLSSTSGSRMNNRLIYIYDNGTNIGSVITASNSGNYSYTVNNLTGGNHTFSVSYGGSGYESSASASATVTVPKNTPTVTDSLGSSFTPGTQTVTVTVSGGATGTVKFYMHITTSNYSKWDSYQTGTLSNGQCSFTMHFSPWHDKIRVVYNGDANNNSVSYDRDISIL